MNKFFKYIIIITAIGLFSGLIYLANTNPQVKKTIALATTVKPETFTELYFEDHLHLPKELPQPTSLRKITFENRYTFAFTIHNLEDKDMYYHYEVYIDSGKNKQIIEQKDIFVKNNESKTIDEIFIVPNKHSRTKVIVNLTNKNQIIAFWMKGTETK